MRVIFLTHYFPRWSGDRSGAALVLLARALMRRGISIRVVAPSDETSGEAELDGIPVHLVKAKPAFGENGGRTNSIAGSGGSSTSAALLRRWRALRGAARQEVRAGADLVHAHSWAPAGLAAPPQAPLVLTLYPADATLFRRSRIARALGRRLLQRAAVVSTVSREVGSWIESGTGRHVAPEHIYPIPVESRGHPWTRGGGGAVTISRLEPSARVGLAIETVAVLASCGHDFPLTIIGGGSERALLEQRATDLGVAAVVRFAGDITPEEARRYLDRADLMLFTAQGDGLALPAIEGLISGIPVVACWDSGAAVDIVPESGAGRLTLPSPESLADSILALQADPDRLAMARLVGESWRARLAPDHVAEICERWYREALAG